MQIIKAQTGYQKLTLTVTLLVSLLSLSHTEVANAQTVDPDNSQIVILNNNIEPLDQTNYQSDLLNLNNQAIVRVDARDEDYLRIDGVTVELTPSPTTNIVIEGINCDDYHDDLGTATPPTDSHGAACFSIFKDLTNPQEASLDTETITITAEVDSVPLTESQEIFIKPYSAPSILNYLFRNDDGDELMATTKTDTNQALYNLGANEKFRLRIGVTRKSPNEFTTSNTDPLRHLSSQHLANFNNYTYYPGYTVANHKLVLNKADNNNNRLLVDIYNTDNLVAPLTSFTVKENLVDDLIFDETTTIVSNVFLDSTDSSLYIIVSPYYENATNNIQILKIDSITGDTSGFIELSNSGQFSLDSEIDTIHGFLYVSVSNSPEAKIHKIRLSDFTILATETINTDDNLITSTAIDPTNQYVYVTHSNPQKISRYDLAVPLLSPPNLLQTLTTNQYPTNSPNEKVGFQASVIDEHNQFVYLGSSTDYTAADYDNVQRAFITKIDVDPSRSMSVISKTNILPIDPLADSYSGSEFVFFATHNLSYDLSNKVFFPKASIDEKNGYAYFPTAHSNNVRQIPSWKITRIDLETFQKPTPKNEIILTDLASDSIVGNVYSTEENRGFFIRRSPTAYLLDSFNSARTQNLNLEIAENQDPNFCNYSSSYSWLPLSGSDIELSNSTFITDNSPTQNATGLLYDNNIYFQDGFIKTANSTPPIINLGRNEYTEIEFSLKTSVSANKSYCLRLVDSYDDNHNPEGRKTLVENHLTQNFDPDFFNYYIPVSTAGIILDNNELAIVEDTVEGTYGIKLASSPANTVTVTPNVSDSRLTLDPNTPLDFDNTNWNEFQYIKITATDSGAEDPNSAQVTHSLTSTDPVFNNKLSQPLNLLITDSGSAITNVFANINGSASFSIPQYFSFPRLMLSYLKTRFSPPLTINTYDTRGVDYDYTLSVQASDFCKTPTICIPLNNVYAMTSNLINSNNNFSNSEISQFMTNYLSEGGSSTDPDEYIHSNPADNFSLASPVTLIDTRKIPSGSLDNPLQGALSFFLHLMIDFPNIATPLETGEYDITLVFDFNTNP